MDDNDLHRSIAIMAMVVSLPALFVVINIAYTILMGEIK